MINKVDNPIKLTEQEREDIEKFIEACTKEIRDYFFDLADTKTEKVKSIAGCTKEEILENVRNGNFETGYKNNPEY